MKNRGLPILLALPASLLASFLGMRDGDAGGRAEKREGGWTAERMIALPVVTGVAPSPDGKRVAYTVRSAVIGPGRSEYVTRLHLAHADGSASAPAEQGASSAHDPHWSPDGKFITFLGPHLGQNNLWLLSVEGGAARPLTRAPTGVSAFAWAPDSKRLAFVMADPPTAAEEQARRDRDDAYWLDETPRQLHLHLIAVATGADDLPKPRRLTRGAFSVNGGFDWSPDGTRIAFTHTRTPKVDDWQTADVSTVEVTTGKVTPLAASAAAEYGPRYSPDGKWIALLASATPPRGLEDVGICVLSADGKTAKERVATPNSRPTLIGWDARGERLLFHEFHRTVTRLRTLDVSTGAIADLNTGQEVIDHPQLNRAGKVLAFLAQGSHRPPEVFVSRADRFAPVQVSRVHAGLPEFPLGKVEVLRWQGQGGRAIEGLLTYPVGYQPGKRVPLLLAIHGGPAGVFSQRYQANPALYPVAAFASRGYALLQPNPRGSTGYGLKFRQANFKDWGGGDYHDLMAGVDHVIKLGVADPERLGVMGWSFGGYMAAWTITQTRRFKAASVGAGVSDLISQAGTTDMPAQRLVYFGTWPWENPDFYAARSPVLRAKGVTTPTLIQHGEQDRRVPFGQGRELYNALRQQGVPVRMLVLPRQDHGPTEPRMLLKVMRTNLDWFGKYLGERER